MKKSRWYLYVVLCRDASLYTGIATGVARRIAEHNAGKGSKALRGRRPVRLVYQERHASRSHALKREAQIKSWPRARKLALVGEKRKPH